MNFSGSYRECFPRSYKLGIRTKPITVTKRCELQRTQRDPTSSIRACLCTTNNCNILESEKQSQRISSKKETPRRTLGKMLHFATILFFYYHHHPLHIIFCISIYETDKFYLTSFLRRNKIRTWWTCWHFEEDWLDLTHTYYS